MSQSKDAQVASEEIPLVDTGQLPEELMDVSVQDVIRFYLDHNPEPSDEEIHNLGESIGLPFEEFEAEIYKMFGEAVNEEDDDDAEDVAEELTGEDEDELDSLDIFIVGYFLQNPEPNDAQIHALARLVGLTPEALEERIYSLMAQFIDEGDEDED